MNEIPVITYQPTTNPTTDTAAAAATITHDGDQKILPSGGNLPDERKKRLKKELSCHFTQHDESKV